MSLSLIKRCLLLFTLLVMLITSIYAWQLHKQFHAPLAHHVETLPEFIDVEPGDGLYKVCQRFSALGLLQDTRSVCRIALWSGFEALKRGRYLIDETDSLFNLLEKMQKGEVMQFDISLIEGHNFEQMLDRIWRNPNVESSLQGLTTEQIMAKVAGDNAPHPEGQFYPDTYFFSYGVSDVTVLKRSYQRLQQILAEEWQSKAKSLPYQSPYEALIMASIVEKETGLASERPEIAAVFVSRLNKGMRLQTDPTVIYGLGDQYQGNITRRHLRQYTPYNTYRINGLPPTPIAMVGRAAIHAALNPADSKALFFVAKGDGSHQFSNTLKEHNKAVRKYQLTRKENYRSAPK